jgi:hypothetical protein
LASWVVWDPYWQYQCPGGDHLKEMVSHTVP